MTRPHQRRLWLLPTVLGASFLTLPANADLEWVKTAKGDGTRMSPQIPLPFAPGGAPPDPNVTLVVDRSVVLQPILGFGGALTESSASVFAKLSAEAQERVLEMYYGEDGIRYTFARTHIGSCDFALEPYTYQRQLGDYNMTTFNMSRDHQLLIPFIQRVKAKVTARNSTFKLVSSPWTPPPWLKTCGDQYCPLICSLQEEAAETPYRSAYALYLSKYLDEMQTAGVKPWAITPQNEPLTCKPVMESMNMFADDARSFLHGQLGPRMRQEHPDVKILGYDHNKDAIVHYATTLLDPNHNASSAGFVDGVAFHWYASHDYFDHLEEVHRAFPSTILLATEATEGKDTGHYARNQSWEKGEHYGHVIMGDLNHWAQGWIDWNILLDLRGGPTHPGPGECEGLIECGDDAMMIANTTFKDKRQGVTAVFPQVFYWYMGHFSRFIEPGSHRIGLTNPLDPSGNGGDAKGVADGSLEALAALNPSGTVTVVVMNRNEQPITFFLQDKSTGRTTTQPITIAGRAIHTYTY